MECKTEEGTCYNEFVSNVKEQMLLLGGNLMKDTQPVRTIVHHYHKIRLLPLIRYTTNSLNLPLLKLSSLENEQPVIESTKVKSDTATGH